MTDNATLLKARQVAREQARQDMHNATRKVLVEEGLSVADIKKEAASMVDKAVKAVLNDMLAKGGLEKLIHAIVKEEISQAFGLKDNFKATFKNAVTDEFARFAREYIKQNLSINLIEGGPGAGSF
jgi:hypothetical protein